ncbi:MAG: hypothetical protein QXG40_02460 [Ignisphaera sp.]
MRSGTWIHLDEGFESRCDALDEGSPQDAQDVVPGVALNTSKGDADPRPMQRKRDEAMKPI